jgi:hypothetical protein
MKRFVAFYFLVLLTACTSQNKYSDFDYSYSRSGGYAPIPIYENLWIKGNTPQYSFEGEGKKVKKEFKIFSEDLQKIENTLNQQNFRTIQEDYKKVYDHTSISINTKKGNNSASKSDASFIISEDKARWEAVVKAFQEIINAHTDLATVNK